MTAGREALVRGENADAAAMLQLAWTYKPTPESGLTLLAATIDERDQSWFACLDHVIATASADSVSALIAWRDNGGRSDHGAIHQALYDACMANNIATVAGVLAARMGTELDHWRRVLAYQWPLHAERLTRNRQGGLALNLDHLPITDLTPLSGMPLQSLSLTDTSVTDLSPLSGMPLQRLDLSNSGVRDLPPLAQMPLRWLSLSGLRELASIQPLAGMPIETLNLAHTKVSNLSPVIGMPLRDLDASAAPLKHLTALDGLPLERLRLHGTTPITDLRPLANSPLRTLIIAWGHNLSDLKPLASLPLEHTRITCLSSGSKPEGSYRPTDSHAANNRYWGHRRATAYLYRVDVSSF